MSEPATNEMTEWLEKLGMSEYADRFVENRIDVSVLPELTDLDLEKIGVALGDRRKILRAIRELASTAPSAQQPVLVGPKPKIPPNVDKSPSCSRTSWVRRHFQPAWTRRTYARSFRPIRNRTEPNLAGDGVASEFCLYGLEQVAREDGAPGKWRNLS